MTEIIQDMEDLIDMGFKVDLLPTDFKRGGMFQLSGYTLLHIKNKICIIVSLEGDGTELPKA